MSVPIFRRNTLKNSQEQCYDTGQLEGTGELESVTFEVEEKEDK